ncbi:MAG: lysoplasmalogenase [Erysipelotrichaceae bacterium]|nr:lysoplasmalogenase [Erysipelotrichaceae bacterium]
MNYWYLIILCFLLMAIFIYFEKNEKYKLAVLFKGLASLMFVVLGILCGIQNIDMEFSKLVKYGLILGLIADILLNLRFVFKQKGKIVFLVGILVFLAGHILYLCALLPKCRNLLVSIIVAVILTVVILLWIFSKIEAQKAFKIFGVFYIGTIVFMNCVAMSNLISDYSIANLVFVIGAISFLISDIVLILNTFGKETKFSLRVTNLSLYYLGQILIAISLSL